MTRNGKKWQLTIDVPRSGRQIADALSEYGSVDVEAGFRLLTEVSATTFDIHPYGSGSDPSKRKFPGILNVILDLVARCHHGKFGFYPLNFVSSKMWNLGLEWWKIGFRPWESFPLEMWNFEMGWFDEKIHWSPFLIWFCLGTMGEICGWLLRYGVTKQFVLACLKRAQDKRKRKRIIKRLKNKRSVKKCSDLKRCQKLLKPHVACAARKCSTHRLGKARLKHRRCALKLRMRWTYVRTNGMDVSLSYSFLYSGFPRPEEWPLGYDALSWYKPDANNCIFASEWLQGGYKRRTQRKKNYSDNDNAAVRSLIQGLKVCLNQGSFPKEFESVMSLLGQVVGQNSPKKMFKKKKTVKQEPKPDPSRQEQLRDNKDEDYTILETGWWKMNGAWKQYCRDPQTGWWWWDKRGDKVTTVDHNPRHNEKKQDTEVHKPQQNTPNLAKVRALNPVEWNKPIKLVDAQTVCQAIKEGKDWDGNICCSHDRQVTQELRDLYTSFGFTKGLTLVLSADAMNQLGITLSRTRLQRTNQHAKVEDIALLGLGSDYPWRTHPVKVDPNNVTTVERELVRIVVPSHYRELFVSEPQKERVVDVISDLATFGCRAHVLTGGRWERQEWQKQSSSLVGWLKLTKKDAETLLEKSGKKGIFINKNIDTSKERPHFVWTKHEKDETDEAYYQRCLRLSGERGQPMCLRKGLGNDIGFTKKSDEDIEKKPKRIQISGVPRDWMAEELVDFLKQQGWTQMTIHNRRRVNKKIFWNACGMPPVAYPYDQGLWVYEGATVFTIIVNDSVHKPAAPNSTTAVRGPRKTWDEIKDQPPQTANTRGRPAKRQAKEPDERHRSRSAAEKPEKGDENKDPMEVEKTQLDSQTQPEAIDKQSSKPTSQSLGNLTDALTQNWTLADQGGCGDCGYRALIDNFHYQTTGETLSKEECIKNANLFRTEVVRHVRKHQDRYENHVRGGKEAFPAFCDNALKQTHWICGLLLQAAAEVKSCCIVVWNQKDEVLERFTFAPEWSPQGMPRMKKEAPILVVYRNDKHYQSVRPPQDQDGMTKVPKHWARETAKPEAEALGGAGPSVGESPKTLHTLSPGSSHAPSLHTLPASSFRGSSGGGVMITRAPSLHSLVPSASSPPRLRAVVHGHAAGGGSSGALARPHPPRSPSLLTLAASPHSCEPPRAAIKSQQLQHPSETVARPFKRCRFKQSSCDSRIEDMKFLAPSENDKASVLSLTSETHLNLTDNLTKDRSGTKDKGAVKNDNTECDFRPDTAPYPRHLKRLDAKTLAKPQGPQVWVCPLPDCRHEIRIPAGLQARAKLQAAKSSHLKNRHTDSERAECPRLGAQTQITVPTSELPESGRAWSCPECGKGLPLLPKVWHEASVRKHFAEAHPDTNPTQAYRKKQRTDKGLRARMKLRGRHIGQLKQQKVADNLKVWAPQTGHDVRQILLKHNPKEERRKLDLTSVLVCAKCRRKGTPCRFKTTACTDETQPIPTQLLGWIRNMALRHPANQGAIRNGLGMTEAEVANANFQTKKRVNGKGPAKWLSGPFATTFQAAQAAGHLVTEVLPPDAMRHPDSTAKKFPKGYLTCKICHKVNPLGAVKIWTNPCLGHDPTSKGFQSQKRYWQSLTKTQKKALSQAWGKTLQQGEELFASQSSNKRSRRAKEHDHNDKVAVRIGEASHPGPRSRKLRNLDQHVSVWTCNTQGPKQSWTLQQLLQTQEQAPQIVLLQECSFSQAEWTTFQKTCWSVGYRSFFSGAQSTVNRHYGGAAVLVKSSLPCRPAWSHTHKGGSAQAVWVGSTLVISTYLAPNSDAETVSAAVAQTVHSLAPRHRFILGGITMPHPKRIPFFIS